KEPAIAEGAGVDATLGALSSSAIARSSFRRWPSKTPMSLRSCSVRSGRTLKSMPFSAKRCVYSDKPRLRSQLETLSIPLSRKKTASARRKCFSVNCVLAEYCLVFAEANIPQPLAHIHDGRPRAHHVAHRLCLQWGPATLPGSSAENSLSLDFGFGPAS